MQNAALQEVLHVTSKSFELSQAIIKTNLFSKVELKPVGRMILLTLSAMYNPKLGYSFPSVNKLSECTGYSDRQVKTGLKELSIAGLLVRTDKKIYFTRKFHELLELKNFCQNDEEFSKTSEVSAAKSEVSSPTCNMIKTNIKTKKEQSFNFKSLLELSKTETISYYKQLSELTEEQKQHLLKIKLGRMNLTSFQMSQLEKLLMLNDFEMQKINSLEPYHKAENIDIFYNNRMRKIRELQEQSQKSEISMPADPKTEVLSMLKVGYKAFSKNKRQLADFISRNKSKMEKYGITESELCANG